MTLNTKISVLQLLNKEFYAWTEFGYSIRTYCARRKLTEKRHAPSDLHASIGPRSIITTGQVRGED